MGAAEIDEHKCVDAKINKNETQSVENAVSNEASDRERESKDVCDGSSDRIGGTCSSPDLLTAEVNHVKGTGEKNADMTCMRDDIIQIAAELSQTQKADKDTEEESMPSDVPIN